MRTDLRQVISHLLPLGEAQKFFCFARVWWDGAGLDAAAWYEGVQGSRRLVVGTGETTEPRDPKTISDGKFDRVALDRLLLEFSSSGIWSTPNQDDRIAHTHYDVWYGMKQSADSQPIWVFIAGGIHKDPRIKELLERVASHAPELFDG